MKAAASVPLVQVLADIVRRAQLTMPRSTHAVVRNLRTNSEVMRLVARMSDDANQIALASAALSTGQGRGGFQPFRMPEAGKLFNLSKAELAQTMRQGLNGKYGRPDSDGRQLVFRVRPDDVHRLPTIIQVKGKVRYPYIRDPIGNVEFHWYSHQRRLEIEVEDISLDWEFQQRGFATSWMRALCDHSRRSNVHQVRLLAAPPNGNWVWGRLGFDWDPIEKVEIGRSFADHLHRLAGAAHIHPGDRPYLTHLGDVFRKLPIELWPTPGELTRVIGRTPNLAEQIMMSGPAWDARLVL